jgi:hypothetical protein
MLAKPGEQIESLCRGATHELLIVAPFMQSIGLKRLLDVVSTNVSIKCVTRWRPIELAMGVSDIDVWNVVRRKNGASLWLRNDLHAKYYRADDMSLVGSANITNAALGWSTVNNLELLVPVKPNDHGLSEFEKILLSGSVEVDEHIHSLLRAAAEDIAVTLPRLPRVETVVRRDHARSIESSGWMSWLPTLRNPHYLYAVYQGNVTLLSSATIETGLADLQMLEIPEGLLETQFNRYVASQLLLNPLVNAVDRFVTIPRRFGEVKTFLRESAPVLVVDTENSSRVWQTLMRWLLHFCPDRYLLRVPHHTEIFQRIS